MIIIQVPYKLFDKLFVSAEVLIEELAAIGLDAGITFDDETHSYFIEIE